MFIHTPEIGSRNKTVEIDEAMYNRGRVIEGTWRFGGIDRETQEFYIKQVPDQTVEIFRQLSRATFAEERPSCRIAGKLIIFQKKKIIFVVFVVPLFSKNKHS